MSETIEQKCQSQGVKLTDQRRIIAKVISESKKKPMVNLIIRMLMSCIIEFQKLILKLASQQYIEL